MAASRPDTGDDQSGFSLIEAVISMAVATGLVLSLAHGVSSVLHAARAAKLLQQATALGTRTLELARDTPYDKVVMRTADLAGDSAITTVGGVQKHDPDANGPLAAETLVHATAGDPASPADPHVDSETVGGTTFTISSYVTWVDEDAQGGAGTDYKRFSVVVRWQGVADTRTYRTSTFLSDVQRGLAPSSFEVSPQTLSKTAAPGERASFGHAIRNDGITDLFELRMPPPSGKSWGIQFFRDVNQDGLYTAAADGTTPLNDGNGDGAPETPLLSTDETFHVVATWLLSGSEPTGTSTLTLTMTSGADASVSRTATDTLTVSSTAGGAVLYLHNKPTPPTANTTAQTGMTMDPNAPTATTLRQYSTDHYSVRPGRFVDKAVPSVTQTDTKYHVAWNYTLGSSGATFTGTPQVRLWVARKDYKCSPNVQFIVYLRQKTSASSTLTESGRVVSATGTFTPTGPIDNCNFGQVNITLPSINWDVPGTRALELKIVTTESTGDAALYAYDTTAHAARLTLP